jgi:GTPase SAR1 family protein
MSLHQSVNLNELKETQNIYKTYSYVVFGSEKVGKTNIITRFVKD